MEVPELTEKSIEIKAIAREAGNRTKIAAVSSVDGVDPVGALVGQRGTRVMAVNNELGNEKIDIAEWSEIPRNSSLNALSPAKVERVEILPRREARAFVPQNQLSLAIGKGRAERPPCREADGLENRCSFARLSRGRSGRGSRGVIDTDQIPFGGGR